MLYLGIDWLAAHHANLDCFNKEVKFSFLGKVKFKFVGSRVCSFTATISTIQAKRLLSEGLQGFLACILQDEKDGKRFEEIPLVRDFSNILFEELPE